MALGSSSAESNSNANSDGKPKGKKHSFGEIIDFCAKAVVMIVGLPVRAAAAIVNQFVANGGAGRALVLDFGQKLIREHHSRTQKLGIINYPSDFSN